MSAAADDPSTDPILEFLEVDESKLHIAPVLGALAAQAEQADRSRSVATEVVEAIRGSDFMRMSATRTLGGTEETMLHMGRELEAVAARCPSTAWCLWNHLCVFHLFVGGLGPDHADFLREIVDAGAWVSFPAGAGSGVHGRLDGDEAVLDGTATWATGSRYADYCGVVFAVVDDDGELVRPMDLRFTIVRTDLDGVKIDPTWDGSGLRASATDDVHYSGVRVPLDRCVSWFGANRAESLRTVPVIDHRYREEWVGLSDLWLGWMAVGVVRTALSEAAAAVRHRRVLMGGKMVERPAVQLGLGKAISLTMAARAAVETACRDVDDRIDAGVVPTEADYFRQQAVVSMAVNQLVEAMDLLRRIQGGTALREGGTFDRRRRDFDAMPLHINVHEDRITHQVGRYALGIERAAF